MCDKPLSREEESRVVIPTTQPIGLAAVVERVGTSHRLEAGANGGGTLLPATANALGMVRGAVVTNLASNATNDTSELTSTTDKTEKPLAADAPQVSPDAPTVASPLTIDSKPDAQAAGTPAEAETSISAKFWAMAEAVMEAYDKIKDLSKGNRVRYEAERTMTNSIRTFLGQTTIDEESWQRGSVGIVTQAKKDLEAFPSTEISADDKKLVLDLVV